MTRFVRTFGVLLLFAALCSLHPAPARASFGDCNAPAYLALFDEALGTLPAGAFDCVASDPIMVTSDEGVTRIRFIQHLQADWALAPGAMRAMKDGAAAAARAMPRLGSFRIKDVTILLVDGLPPGADAETQGQIAAWTSFSPGEECRITVWLLGPGATAAYGGSVVAHELFHCVETATLTQSQITTGNVGVAGGGTWWIEGAADWFSTVALPPAAYMQGTVDRFDAQAPTTSINGMAYEAYVFFAWLGGSRGAESVMPFLHQMSESTSESGQRAAMTRALAAEDWLRFAEDYADQNIRDGQGGSINSTPQAASETYTWSATRTQRIDLAPFTVTRRNLTFECGRWSIAPRPARHHAGRSGGGAWGDLPADLDNLDHAHGDFEFIGMNASASAVALNVAGTLAARCQVCGTEPVVLDRCMIGTWEMTTNGAEQWMRENVPNFRVTGLSAADNTLTLNPDGTFFTGAARTHAAGESDRASGEANMTGQATGRWATSGGALTLCYDSGSASGTVTVRQRGGSATAPFSATPPPTWTTPYQCTSSTLTQQVPMGSRGPVNNIYTRRG
ncbi:hypothetical protein [Terricaulis sp.]|uniref:hypothetical protein n=1 Tax=Terricaulis sp. TaxID=2768686 RepID=UPI0037844371